MEKSEDFYFLKYRFCNILFIQLSYSRTYKKFQITNSADSIVEIMNIW